ncbi:hypothetical protein EIK77_008791 [Talaromyces pinophilus]|nr:hypothetical protein EIK77_008791 [Talaromyces pinophilus]
MSSEGTTATVCLGVAIDHRIRRLFRPVPSVSSSAGHGKHISIVRAKGGILGLPEDEIQVTAELAGPETTGGIAIALQQPREDHPFEDGIRAVIDDCDTLTTLEELFAVVSCNTLGLISDVSVIDLLLYTSKEDMEDMDHVSLSDRFRASIEVFCNKKPDVLLCAGKIPLDKQLQQCKGDAQKLEHNGVGKTFGRYQDVTISDGNNNRVRIRRVNGFHPSHAIHYHPEQSCLIQLLLLIVSQTCGTLRADWVEESWMHNLRSKCWELPRERERRFLSEYADYYRSITRTIRETIAEIASSNNDPYKGLLESGLSEQLNDASLVLRVMGRMDDNATLEWVADKNEEALKQAARDTISLTQSWRGNGWFRSRDI